MKRTDVVVIGGGQAGLAMSRSLTDRAVDHVVLERGRIGERWRSERWDSLRMLTPRWQSRLPGWSYRGPDPEGFMTKDEVVAYLEGYGHSFSPPIRTGVSVLCVKRTDDGFAVETDGGEWRARNVVIATGACGKARVPSSAADLDAEIGQVVPTAYRNPSQLADGGVLVVGASATGIQLAAEIQASGRPVTLAVGRHTRLPRRYRGRDIMAWLDDMGVLDETADDVQDIERSRRQRSLQLIGSQDHRSLDLARVRDLGVRVVGRFQGAEGSRAYFSDDLHVSVAEADRKLTRQLDQIDRFVSDMGWGGRFPNGQRPSPIDLPPAATRLDLTAEGIRTVLWATGYRREYPWLRIPVLDPNGELQHVGGVTPVAGLYALGLPFQRRRNSSFLDGVGSDAIELANRIWKRTTRPVLVGV
ncbi:MAG: NAD(P)-binding domain-containing protein [Candidatus Eisenbacteria bacterium]|uniref:NAD(P)-binding domain-containing protein n=1 Tax=Eiseniibacteriota bacterium TaxID=2212470 RepID=A0A956LZB4_UNCEI|nr:NAD(P)-binding domain-containing protein [Candidatus Eisenbacteria bacterium]